MKNALYRLKRIICVGCFFALNSLSAMDNAIDEQAKADKKFYNELVEFNAKVESLGQSIPTEFDSASLEDELGIMRYWSLLPEGVIVISKSKITNHVNVIFRSKIKASGTSIKKSASDASIKKSANELLETNAYPEVYLTIGADFTHYQILAAMGEFREAVTASGEIKH